MKNDQKYYENVVIQTYPILIHMGENYLKVKLVEIFLLGFHDSNAMQIAGCLMSPNYIDFVLTWF